MKWWRRQSETFRWAVWMAIFFCSFIVLDLRLLYVDKDVVAFESVFGIIVVLAMVIRGLLIIPAPTLRSTPLMPTLWHVVLLPLILGLFATVVVDWLIR